MLIVMKNWNIALFLEPSFNFKTAGSGDILQINSAKASCQQLYGVYNSVHIIGTDAKRECVYITEGLKKNTFSFHNRHACFRADVAETKHSTAVCYHGDKIMSSGQFIRFVNIFLDIETWLGDSGSICDGKIILIADGSAADHFNFTFPFGMGLY